MDKKETLLAEAKETFLQVLLLAYTKAKQLGEQGDLAGKEKLETEVIEKYEKLYFALEDEGLSSCEEEDFVSFEKHLREIQLKHQFSKEWIEEQCALRKDLKGKSGAEVVKRLLYYQKKELEKQLRALLERASTLLTQEETLNLKLSNDKTIQHLCYEDG